MSQGRAVIVDYMDVIAAHQHGFDNVVASMGRHDRAAGALIAALGQRDRACSGRRRRRQRRGVRDMTPSEALQDTGAAVPVSWRGLASYQQMVDVG
jgi:hypothetical protein